jgi:hypothetical protein
MKQTFWLLPILIIASLFYLLTLKGVYGNPDINYIQSNLLETTKPLEGGPELGRYVHILSLAKNHTYALTENYVTKGADFGYYGGKFFGLFAPGVAYLVLPFYILGQHFNMAMLFSFGSEALFMILCLFFMLKICLNIFKFPLWVSFFVILTFAFGCTSWGYAVTLYEHAFTVFFIISSFYAVWKYKQNQKYSYIWAIFIWVNYGLAIFVDYPNAILMLPIMVYFLVSSISIKEQLAGFKVSLRPSFLYTFIFFLLISGAHAYHNYHYFGSWKTISSGILNYNTYKTISQATQATSSSFQSLINTAQGNKQISKFIQDVNIPKSFYVLIFESDKGILIFCPIFLLSLFGIYSQRKKWKTEHSVLLAIILVNLLFYSSWGDPWGGWAYGPRYLIPSMAVLSVFLGFIFENNNKILLKKIVCYLFFSASSAIALLGVLTTNQLVPSIENDTNHVKHNFLYNLDFLKQNKSSSYIFNTYFSSHISLVEYYLIIYGLLMLLLFIVIFIAPNLGSSEKKIAINEVVL